MYLPPTSFVCLTLIAATLLVHQCNGNYWDGIPVISQIKSLVQVIRGDAKAAKITQENFLDQALVVSQIKSAVQAVHGDGQGAVDTQMKFLHDKESVVNGWPGIGHIKGAVHVAAGDRDRGLDVFEDASNTVVAAVNGVSGVMYAVPAVVFGSSAASVYGRLADDHVTKKPTSVDNYVAPNYNVGNYEKAVRRRNNSGHTRTSFHKFGRHRRAVVLVDRKTRIGPT